jgi:uncharacterized radical SAM superfamily Fe-S cluster-containing enzyme
MPTCNFVTYAMIDGDTVTPITRILDISSYLNYIKNRTLPALNDELLTTLERLWSSSAKVGSDEAAHDITNMLEGKSMGGNGHTSIETTRAGQRCTSCHAHLPLSEHTPRDLGRHVFMINTRDFMDPWTFNVKNAMKCCVEFLVPDGRMIPFCTYNTVGYREQIAASISLQKK